MSEVTLRAIEAAGRDYHKPDVAQWMRDLARSIATVRAQPQERKATASHILDPRAQFTAPWN
jgi:hypothetical protein